MSCDDCIADSELLREYQIAEAKLKIIEARIEIALAWAELLEIVDNDTYDDTFSGGLREAREIVFDVNEKTKIDKWRMTG